MIQKATIKIIISIIVLTIAIITLSAFQSDNLINSPEVKEGLKARLDDYRKTMFNNCKERATKRAEIMVDSILEANARGQRIQQDTVTRPAIPEKPPKPESIIINDSTPVAPLLKE